MTSVNHLSRQMIVTWDWQQKLNDPDPMIQRAARCVERDHRIASDWLSRQSSQLHFPLPLGNGTDGPWNRIALVDAGDHLVLLDIARGVAYHTDAAVPSAVLRFACRTDNGVSPHIAGGSGSMPVGCRQIAIMISGREKSRAMVDLTARVVRVEYGFRTCYGTVETADDIRSWHAQFPSDAPLMADDVEWRETTIPQRVKWAAVKVHIERDVYDDFAKFVCRLERTADQGAWQSNYSILGARVRAAMSWGLAYSPVLGDIEITGTRAEREEFSAFLDREWAEFCDWRIALAADAERARLHTNEPGIISTDRNHPPTRIIR